MDISVRFISKRAGPERHEVSVLMIRFAYIWLSAALDMETCEGEGSATTISTELLAIHVIMYGAAAKLAFDVTLSIAGDMRDLFLHAAYTRTETSPNTLPRVSPSRDARPDLTATSRVVSRCRLPFSESSLGHSGATVPRRERLETTTAGTR